MSDFINQFNSRQLAKLLCMVIAVIVLLFKLIIPKIKEKMDRAAVKSAKNNNGADYISQGYDSLRNGDEQSAVTLFEQGLGAGADDLGAYKFLVTHYTAVNQYHKSLHWGRRAVEHNVYDKELIDNMIALYQLSGEDEKIDELQKLL